MLDNLINFDGLGDFATNLTNRLSDGIGWLANKETPKKIALDTFIDDIKKSEIDSLTKCVLISNAKKIIKEYSNQNEIIEQALESMNGRSHPEQIENDWLNKFMDEARLISDREFQLIWGKILAEECTNPNSIPKSLLHILPQMDKRDAVSFTKVCSVSVFVNEDDTKREYSPVIFNNKINEYYSMLDITYDDLVDLKALGLIEMNFSFEESAYGVSYKINPVVINYFNESIQLPEGMNGVNTGNVIFTKAGKALCSAISTSKQDGFWENYCLPNFKKDITAYNAVKSNDNLTREK